MRLAAHPKLLTLATPLVRRRLRQASEDSNDAGSTRLGGNSVKWMDASANPAAAAGAGGDAALAAAAQAAAAARTFNREVGMGGGAARSEAEADDAAIVAAAMEAERRAGGRSPPPMEASRNMPDDAQTLLSVTKSGFKLVKPFYR